MTLYCAETLAGRVERRADKYAAKADAPDTLPWDRHKHRDAADTLRRVAKEIATGTFCDVGGLDG